MAFFDSSKKAFTKRPSASKAISNHPPLSDPGSRHHDSPKKDPTTTMFPLKETQTIPPESIHVPSDRVPQTLKVLSKEKKGLRGQLLAMQDDLDTALDTSEEREKEIARLEEYVQRLDSIMIFMVSAEKIAWNKISELERKLLQQDKNIIQRDENIRNLEQKLRISQVSAEKMAWNKISELERKLLQQDENILQRDENIRNLEQKLRISQEQHSQATKLLEDRTAQLKDAQAFLTAADRYSGADIIKMAESLNTEIFQASALMAELLVDAPVVEESVQHRQHIQKYEKHLEYGRKQIGSRLFDHLATRSREIRVDPLPLQLAFQALFTSWCVCEVNQFCEGQTGQSLKRIYGRIYNSETQAVAGRWRAMTSVQTMNSDAPSNASYVYNIILGLMLICGGFGSRDTSLRAKVSVRPAVLRVEKMWKTLKAAAMQEITAAEITMIGIGPGSDYNADKMDDMYMIDASSDVRTNPNNHEQHILCPVGVGLRRDVSKRCKDGTIQINREVILKPKIALASVLLKGEPSPDTQMMLDGKD